MATRIIRLDLEDEDVLEEFETHQRIYHKGFCIAFAAAMHRITGWEIVAIDTKKTHLTHCGVRAPDGTIWDGRGPVTPHQFIESFVDTVPERFRTPTWDELRAAWPPIDLPATERIASQMYPDLPHLSTSDRSRTVQFVDEVEELSRQCNLWIRAPDGAISTHPVIAEWFEEVVGYRVALVDGIITFDRVTSLEVSRGPNHMSQRTERFIAGLTSLSERHRLWVRAAGVTIWPRLVMLDGHEQHRAHYHIQQMGYGGGFLLNLSCH